MGGAVGGGAGRGGPVGGVLLRLDLQPHPKLPGPARPAPTNTLAQCPLAPTTTPPHAAAEGELADRLGVTIIALVMLALSAGPMPATIGGFVLGLVQDVANPPLLGLRSLCKCVLGFGLGRLRGRLVHGVIVVDAVMIVVAVLLHDFVFLLVQSNLTQERFLVPLLTQSLPTAVYSALVGVPLLRLAEMLGVMNPED